MGIFDVVKLGKVISTPNKPCLWGAGISDIGLVRDNNEDNFILFDYISNNKDNVCRFEDTISAPLKKWQFFAVFDGMGGGQKGDVASLLTAQIFKDSLNNLGLTVSKDDLDQIVRRAFYKANKQINLERSSDEKVMGTTAVLVATDGFIYKIYHSGDSRAYRLKNDDIIKLTTDHSMAEVRLKMGLLEPDSPEFNIYQHQLSEFVGCDRTGDEYKPTESPWYTWGNDEAIMLCSDGLYEFCTEPVMSVSFERLMNPAKFCEHIVDYTKKSEGDDNTTCVLVRKFFPSENT